MKRKAVILEGRLVHGVRGYASKYQPIYDFYLANEDKKNELLEQHLREFIGKKIKIVVEERE